jgi:hypothetical protein
MSFVVGSGGNGTYAFGPPQPGSRFRNARDFGVLELALYPTSFEWSFIASGRGSDGSTSFDTNNAGEVLDSGIVPTRGAPRPVKIVFSVPLLHVEFTV